MRLALIYTIVRWYHLMALDWIAPAVEDLHAMSRNVRTWLIESGNPTHSSDCCYQCSLIVFDNTKEQEMSGYINNHSRKRNTFPIYIYRMVQQSIIISRQYALSKLIVAWCSLTIRGRKLTLSMNFFRLRDSYVAVLPGWFPEPNSHGNRPNDPCDHTVRNDLSLWRCYWCVFGQQ